MKLELWPLAEHAEAIREYARMLEAQPNITFSVGVSEPEFVLAKAREYECHGINKQEGLP